MSTNQAISFEERKDGCKPLVLVVDDDHTHRKLMELLADRLDITAQCVGSCDQALAAMEMFSFDLILMDCRMPDVDGCYCTGKIRALANENAKKIPIIAVTGCVMPGDKERCLNAGMDDYLIKPFTLEQMHEKLRTWLQKRDPN
jgi:CheY-like chemotaxis protein